MNPPILLDLTHTSHTRARTGIQRVTRGIWRALGAAAAPVTHDPHWSVWRPLEPWEQAALADSGGAARRGARWPLAARLRSFSRRQLRRPAPALPPAAALVVPEVFSAATGRALPDLLARVGGPRVAVFHDAIALQFPELSPRRTVARFPAYLAELLAFDGVAAVSDDSRRVLLGYWSWLGISRCPPVVALPLAVDPVVLASPAAPPTAGEPPVVLSVGSIEGRKNHLALLQACESLWNRGTRFSLQLIGLPQTETGAAALELLRSLQAAGRPIRYDGPVSDAEVEAAYARCAFTVYPSLKEGFGLPVLESVGHGKPCICSGSGALGEAARGGGCVVLAAMDAPALAAALARLIESPGERARLAAEAAGRPSRTWNNYVRDLQEWMRGLRRRD